VDKPKPAAKPTATFANGYRRRFLTHEQHQALRRQLLDLDAKYQQMRAAERER